MQSEHGTILIKSETALFQARNLLETIADLENLENVKNHGFKEETLISTAINYLTEAMNAVGKVRIEINNAERAKGKEAAA
ncbi:hypothetical protein LJC42_01690 [Eubacteriales bacterium OttesenSCG-928-K08]|nr:hypothetical protein [Eubacteriales bacterium OttesenSCG-928-K08]